MAERRPFGRLRKRASGHWQAGYLGPDGKVHYAPTTFEAKDDAVVWLTGERRLLEQDTWTPPATRKAVKHKATATLADFAPGWLATHKRSDGQPLKDRTREHYQSLLDLRILPFLGDVPMRRITDDRLITWHEQELPKNTPVANAHAYALLREILTTAAEKDPAIRPPAIPGASKAKTKHRAEPASLDELAVIVANMPERYQLAILLMSWCALRFGETAELRRRDVDLRNGRVKVRRAVVRVEHERRVTTPKSEAGIRDVAIPPHLVYAITDHLDRFAEPGPDGLLFPAVGGGHLAQSTLNGKPSRRRRIKGRMVNESATGFCKAREAAGRADLHLHDLRHTGAVLAAQTGATLAELMARLGHSTPGAAMRYQHAAADRDKAIAAKLSEMAQGGHATE
jgi:integrase